MNDLADFVTNCSCVGTSANRTIFGTKRMNDKELEEHLRRGQRNRDRLMYQGLSQGQADAILSLLGYSNTTALDVFDETQHVWLRLDANLLREAEKEVRVEFGLE